MKRLLICFILLLHFPPPTSYAAEIEKLLSRLDSLIQHKDDFVKAKERKLAELVRRQKNARTLEELYWLNKMCYDEYSVYDADSAFLYIQRNLDVARQLHKPELEKEWRIKKSFVLAATGLLKEAADELRGISGADLSPNLRTEYYGQMIYLYSHLGQYSGAGDIATNYYQYELAYRDSIYTTVRPEDPLYLWHKGWKFRGTEHAEAIKEELVRVVDGSNLDDRIDAMNAYVLSHLYSADEQQTEAIKYLIYSAFADVRIANKDIASLEELGKALFEQGDLEHASRYLSYCLQHAQLYDNRVRALGIYATQEAIYRAYQEQSVRQQARLHVFLIVVSILSVILVVMVFFIYRQMKRLSQSEGNLNRANGLLNEHVEELSQAQAQLAEVNSKLQEVNGQLQEVNSELRESNHVKEEYIGNIFAICSNYISKLDAYRKHINRKARARQFDEIQKLTDTPTMAQSELKEFYQSFDAVFLNIYPNFVRDFNALLRPEEQITLREGELLNTDLRIYALVRLGITDSVKIAEFLHCSAQTVYNIRLKVRNKAIIPKEDFAKVVRSLGKVQG
ncbi:DUF6377 domain-containing protein [uncultured Alistipes sp.]|jgi:hypothetical protein|uniref:DUF6377 domain-containing protein n=1 Tax=uncultured Alistipes sp. TaxID=538949 RepID=UPI0025FDE5E0|nr:DUF6377 domain-containing protein [uncultured Alistipes sp.]